MRLSIIIPVYNVEAYLSGCLDSCLGQDIPPEDYEIIAVNDGSTDGSEALLHSFTARYGNIRCHTQSNRGLSGARNSGLDLASGEYIWFVDGDDGIRPHTLKELLDIADSCNCDILTFDYLQKTADGERVFSLGVPPDTDMSGERFLQHNPCGISACRHLYRRSFLEDNSLRFVEGLFHEDTEFNLRAFLLASKVIYHKEHYYLYDSTRGNSITHSSMEPRMISMLRTIELAVDFLAGRRFGPETTAAVSQLLTVSCVRPALRMCGHPGVSATPLIENIGNIRKVLRGLPPPDGRGMRILMRLPAPVIAILLKAACRMKIIITVIKSFK